MGYKGVKYYPYIGQYLRAGNQDGSTWSEGQGYEGVLLLVDSDTSGARVKGQRRVKHNGDDAGVDQWKRGSKCDGIIRGSKRKRN